MKLPFWPKQVEVLNKPGAPIKNYVDPETRKELEGIVKSDKSYQPTKKYTSREQLLAYLSETHTIQEIMARFGYGTLASAYASIYKLIRAGEITNIGHGLYVSANAGVKSFNVGQLSERELQERGLESYKRTLNTSVDNSPEPNKPQPETGRRRPYHARKAFQRELLDFLGEPRTVRDVMFKFDYATVMGPWRVMKNMVEEGLLVELPNKVRGYKGQLATQYQNVKHVTRESIIELAEAAGTQINQPVEKVKTVVATTPYVMPQFRAGSDGSLETAIENLAMRYIWEKESINDIERAILKRFVAYTKGESR